jgi:hypothetical protein
MPTVERSEEPGRAQGLGGTTTEGEHVMVDLIIKPKGRGNWKTSSLRASGNVFRVGETIRMANGQLYRIVDIKPVEAA